MKRGNRQLEQGHKQNGMVLIYTLIFITIMGLILSQLSRNLKLEQQISFALNQQNQLVNTLENYARRLSFSITKNINWQQLADVQRLSPLTNLNSEIDTKSTLSCNDSQYYLFNTMEGEIIIKVPMAATFLKNSNEGNSSYLAAALVCVSNAHVQFWLSELVLLKYFQNGTVSKLYTEQFQQLKGQ